jgi:hypothetical protein
MKSNPSSLVRKLLSAIPLVAIQRNAAESRPQVRSASRNHPAERDQNLNRIFMVRFRTQQL